MEYDLTESMCPEKGYCLNRSPYVRQGYNKFDTIFLEAQSESSRVQKRFLSIDINTSDNSVFLERKEG